MWFVILQLMSAVTADAANASSNPLSSPITIQGNSVTSSTQPVRYFIQRGPNNSFRATPALPNSPLVSSIRPGSPRMVSSQQMYVSPSNAPQAVVHRVIRPQSVKQSSANSGNQLLLVKNNTPSKSASLLSDKLRLAACHPGASFSRVVLLP